METVLWIIQILLAAVFLAAGLTKLMKTHADLARDPRMSWTEDFTPQQVKGIGAVEVLGAIGLILPAALDVVPVLTAVAAAGLALTMLGAIATHIKRKEGPAVAPAVVLFALAVFVAVERFGPHSL